VASNDLIKDGDYARKQIFCKSRVVAWSHGSRFEWARRLVIGQGDRLLDYGCGDGTFIAMVHEHFKEAVGVDMDVAQTDECTRRLGGLPNVRFGLASEMDNPSETGQWDVVTCMEVLEHCLEPERRRVLDGLARIVAPTGTVIISVPIEVGPSLLGKQFFRALAGLRRLGDYQYRERYSPVELLLAAAGGSVPRSSYEGDGAFGRYRYYGHKGFDFRELEKEIESRLVIVKRFFSPLPWLGPLLNSQAWFVCARRE
jgi:SAM-dependent methyltransferase